MPNDEHSVVNSYFNPEANEPEPDYSDDGYEEDQSDISRLADAMDTFNATQEQQAVDEFWSEPDPETGTSNAEEVEYAKNLFDEKYNAIREPFQKGEALFREWDSEREAERDEWQQEQMNEAVSDLQQEAGGLIQAAMHQQGLQSPEAYNAIEVGASALLEGGMTDDPDEAVSMAARDASALLMAHKVGGGLMSAQTRSQMLRMGKTNPYFGMSGANRRLR
jgi:hypothetical protein